jgi:hypothetical protein
MGFLRKKTTHKLTLGWPFSVAKSSPRDMLLEGDRTVVWSQDGAHYFGKGGFSLFPINSHNVGKTMP